MISHTAYRQQAHPNHTHPQPPLLTNDLHAHILDVLLLHLEHGVPILGIGNLDVGLTLALLGSGPALAPLEMSAAVPSPRLPVASPEAPA